GSLKLGLRFFCRPGLSGAGRIVLSQRGLDEPALHAAGEQAAADPLAAPLLELALVGHEQAREPTVVEEALLAEDADRGRGQLFVHAAALETEPDLVDGAVTRVQIRVGDVQR